MFWANRAKCGYCGKEHKDNCDFSFPADCKILSEFLSRDPNRKLVLVLQWRNNPPAKLEMIEKPLVKTLAEEEIATVKLASDSKITLYDCLNCFTLEETLSGNDKWYCGKCKDHVVATKKMEVYRTPEVLIVHFKRFSHSRGSVFSGSKKITDKIDFPIEGLNMSSYVLQNTQGSKIIYDLYAVSNHFGGLSGGHYTAFAKNPIQSRWYQFDDSVVTKCS
jgi:ubiquitin carboxyl-terminal hydrolase 4/11